MNDNKLFLDQIVLKKDTYENGTEYYKALGYSFAVPAHVDLSVEILDDKNDCDDARL